MIIQDAELELSPQDYPAMLRPILNGSADAVFGSRFSGQTRRVMLFWQSVANRLLTLLANVLLDLNLTDFGTGYKAMRGDFARTLMLKAKRFGIEAELTARLAHAQARIYEVPVRYTGRTYDEGKKIRWTDGLAVPFQPSMRQTLRALDRSNLQFHGQLRARMGNQRSSTQNYRSVRPQFVGSDRFQTRGGKLRGHRANPFWLLLIPLWAWGWWKKRGRS